MSGEHADVDVQRTVRNLVAKKDERRRTRETRTAEAEIRRAIKIAEESLAGLHHVEPEPLLEALHEFLWADDQRQEVLHPGFDGLDQQTKVQFRRLTRALESGRYPDPMAWLGVLEAVAIAMGFFSDPTDKTTYAPVRFERLESQGGAGTLVEEVTPVGRLRLPHDSAATIEDRTVELPIRSCEHVLTVALPRKGKDSTNARVCGNLKDEHGYKWVSILDDGRNELPMIAIPSDDSGVRENLRQLGQAPKAYDTEVFVPAMPGLPDRLPGNHRPFTIGLDSLTPELILRLGGIRSINANTESRIARALKKTLAGTGAVDDLVDRLESEAGEMEATIQITELSDGDDDGQVREITYAMDEDSAMREAGQAVARLAGDGLIEDADVETNLDIEAIIRRSERVAVLNCNFLEAGDQALRYVIMDMWMQMIYRARKQNSRLPRVAMEIRELKNLAPSKLADVRYKDAIKATQQTLYTLASQGSAERVMIVGSTQKLNEVYKAVRNNMLTKILLQSGDEQIDALGSTYNFSREEEEKLGEFQVGWGMVVRPEQRDYPVQLCAARCGLGQGDRHWLDRYGIAWGARVRESTRDRWQERFGDVDWWVEVNDVEVLDGDVPPTVGDHYSEWYLLDRDFPQGTTPADVDADLVEAVLEDRREYEIASDLSLRSVKELQRERTEVFRDLDEAQEERLAERLEEHNVPSVLHGWATTKARKRSRMLDVIRTVRDEHVSKYKDVTDQTAISVSTVSDYVNENGDLGACIVKDQDLGRYAVTPIGETALELPWAKIAGDE